MPLASARVATPLPCVQLRAAQGLTPTPPLRRSRRQPWRGGTTVAVRNTYWRRLADGARMSDRELRLKEAAKWENEQSTAAAAEHLAEHGSVEQSPSRHLDKSTLTGVDNEPAPHHHDVPIVPVPKANQMASPELPLYPPALRVKAPRIPAGILVTSVRAPTPPMALEGPIGTGVGVTAVLLCFFGLVTLGRLAARWRDSRSPEQPLFRPPRYPRWWWLP